MLSKHKTLTEQNNESGKKGIHVVCSFEYNRQRRVSQMKK